MAKLILEMQQSLDGYMAGPEGQTDWMIWNWGPDWTWDKELQDFHTQLTLSAEHIIISRQMAQEGFMAHWQRIAARNDEQSEFARHISKTPKTVVSTTLTKDTDIPGGWNNAEIAADVNEAVNRLKRQTGGNIVIYGGASLVSSLLEHNLIDELYLLINPVVIGSGMSVFNTRRRFQLEEARPFPSGVTLLHYSA